MQVALGFTRTTSGIIDASATRSPSRPWTRPYWSTTAMGSASGPILQVPEEWWPVVTFSKIPLIHGLLRSHFCVIWSDPPGQQSLSGRGFRPVRWRGGHPPARGPGPRGPEGSCTPDGAALTRRSDVRVRRPAPRAYSRQALSRVWGTTVEDPPVVDADGHVVGGVGAGGGVAEEYEAEDRVLGFHGSVPVDDA